MITFQPTDLLRILPEIILCGFGILVMVLEPFMPPARKFLLGWLALAGMLVAAGGTLWTSYSPGLAFAARSLRTIQFLLLLSFLLVAALTLLGSINYLERDGLQHGEFYALVLLGTAGMCFMAASTDLILVFIGLEISSISTYILVGFGAKTRSPTRLRQVLPAGLLRHRFLPLWDCLCLRTDRHHQPAGFKRAPGPSGAVVHAGARGSAVDVRGPGLQAFHRPFSSLDAGRLPGSARAGHGIPFRGPQGGRLCRPAADFAGRSGFRKFRQLLAGLGFSDTDHVPGNLAALWQTNVKRLLAYSAIAQAGYVLVGVAAGSNEGTSAVLFYLTAYALMNAGAFVLVAHLGGNGERSTQIEDYTGLGLHPAGRRRLPDGLPDLAGWIPHHGGFLRKILPLPRRHSLALDRPHHHRPLE